MLEKGCILEKELGKSGMVRWRLDAISIWRGGRQDFVEFSCAIRFVLHIVKSISLTADVGVSSHSGDENRQKVVTCTRASHGTCKEPSEIEIYSLFDVELLRNRKIPLLARALSI